MKLRTMAIAVAGACTSMAAVPSFALSPAASATAVAAGRVVYASGASAPTRIVFHAFAQFCQPGTGDAFTSENVADNVNVSPGDTSWKNFLAYSCTFTAAAPVFASQNVVLLHTVDGGSFKSVEGLSSNAALQVQFIDEGFVGCVDNGASNTFNTGAAGVFNVQNQCSRDLNSLNGGRSNGGFSDIEKQIFADVVATSIDPALAGINAAVTVTPTFALQTFGVAVSPELYGDMQAAQGLVTTAGGNNDACDLANDANTPACQPSISQRQYASIVQSNPFSITKVDWSWLTGVAQNVLLCRRVDTSGTQGSSNVYFLDNPCGRGPSTFGERTIASIANGDESLPNFDISENASTSNVKSCLSAAGVYAIGVVSGENLRTGAATDDWAWVKLDGVAINEDANHRQSSIDGRYDFAFEIVLHRHPTLSLTGPGGDNASRPTLLGAIATTMGTPGFAGPVRGLYQGATGGCIPGTDPECGFGERGGSTPNACAPFTF